MIVEVFVTRAPDPHEGAQVPIPEGDWRALIDGDPDLVAPDEAYPNFARWRGRAGPAARWIDWADGNLFTRSPDSALLSKLLELAGRLDARVLGADGSCYRLDGSRVVREPPARPRSDAPAPDEPSPIERERREAGRRIAPRLEEILEEAEPDPGLASTPPAGVRSEALFGPRPRNAEPELSLEADGSELHAEAAFARRPEEAIDLDAGPLPLVHDLPFAVGDRVRTSWGRPATVVGIDPKAEGGVGEIEIRYDDGRVAAVSCMAHGLIPL